MAEINYTNVSDLPVLEEATENTHVIVEDGGVFKRMSGDNLGGGGIKTAIIRDSEYLNTIAGLQTAITDAPALTYECINMTFEEAYQTMAMGEPLAVIGQFVGEGAMCVNGTLAFIGDAALGVPCLSVFFTEGSQFLVILYWTADGLSTEAPEQP